MFRSLQMRIRILLSVTVVLAPLAVSAQGGSSGTGRGVVIMRPGIEVARGFWSPGTLRRFHVTTDDYLHHVFILKTRRFHDVGKGNGNPFDGELGAVLNGYGVTSVRAPFPEYAVRELSAVPDFGLGRIYEVSYSADIDPLDLCDQLNDVADVEYAEPVYIRHTTAVPNDPQFGEQYALQLVEAAAAWDVTEGDGTVRIAIVDAGVDWTHHDLASKIWMNPNEVAGNTMDDDGSGKIDDIRGWDFVGNISAAQALQNQFQEDNDPGVATDLTPRDGRYHGTHCAGVAGAATNNDTGMAGMGNRCMLIPIKCGSDQIPGSIYRGYEAINYAARLGADVISCSWGGGTYSAAEADVIAQATAMGSLVVAASGNDALDNDNFSHYPSSYPNVLSVNASDRNDRPAVFTNYGITTTVFAPGVNILSTVGGDRYSSEWSGTSMAAPLVSGIAALVKSLHPTWTPLQILHQIRGTVDDVVSVDPTERPVFYGRVNARRAVGANRPGSDTNLLPGIGVIATAIDAPGGIITDTTAHELRLTLRNHLAPVKNLTVTIAPFSNDVEVIGGPLVVDSLGTLATTGVDVMVRVRNSSAWYQGTAGVLVRYQSEGYDDYALVQVPYQFPSRNTYTLLVSGLPGKTVANGGHSPAPGTLWAVGEVPGLGGGFIRIAGVGFNYGFISPGALRSIYAFDATTALTVSGSFVFRTANQGSSWPGANVSTISTDLRSIHFISAGRGIIVGNPVGGLWGIGRTTDSARTWSPLALPVGALDDEAVETNGVEWRGVNGWFGTSKGRVFRSNDTGLTWTPSTLADGADIAFLAFSSTENGVAIYRSGSDTTVPYMLANTTDGGATWATGVARIDDLGILPVHLASPGQTGVYVLMGIDGRVALSTDNGVSWSDQPTLNTNSVITAGTTSSDNTRIRVWTLGTSLGYLDIPFNASSAPRELGIIASPGHITSIHPNPVAGSLTVDLRLTKQSDVVIDLLNEVGQVVHHRACGRVDAGERSIALDTEGLPAAAYLCRVTVDGFSEGRMIVVRR